MSSKTSLHLVQPPVRELRADVQTESPESPYLVRADRRSTYSRWTAGEASRPRVSLIIPALNEEKSIGAVLRDIPRAWVDEVIVVDNDSMDGTAAIAREAGAKVVHQPLRGYGAACLKGLAAVQPDSEIIVFLDADYSDFPEEIRILVRPLFDGSMDLAIGTRTLYPAARVALSPQQRWGNRLATTLVRLLFGHRYTDLGPFRAIRRDALDRLGMSDTNYGWTIEMQIKAIKNGLRIVEIPVRYRVRIGGSKISGTVKGTVLAGSKIIYTIFKYAVRSA